MKRVILYGYGQTGKAIFNELRKKYDVRVVKRNTWLKKREFSKGEVIILAIGNLSKLIGKKWKSTYDIRLEETKKNKKSVERFARKVKNINLPIIILTNNADMFEKYLRAKLKRTNIFAFGKVLDEKRFSLFLGKKIKVAGYHGLALPILSKKNKEDYFKVIKKVDNSLLNSFNKKKLDYVKIAHTFSENFKETMILSKAPKLNEVEKSILNKFKKKFEEDYNRIFK
jgi:hypothetical protein